ncbi:hypothetical protein [Paenibacillus sp. FSL K6-1230]|uniref:hypothetical protein n=1 Tax=Paenibacillus sp. FSL K6-1230 TaxID=2921603 RepID=UPI0030FA6C02
MKKITLFTLVLALSAVLTACGGKTETTSSEQTTPPATTQEAPAAQAAVETAAEEPLAEEPVAEEPAEVPQAQGDTMAADLMNELNAALVDGETLDPKSYDFLVAHADLFPATTAEAKKEAAKLVDKNVSSRHLFKNINPYLDTMVTVSGYVLEITEEESAYGTIAFIHIIDENDNSITGIYNNETGDILDGDDVTLRGVPVTNYSFDNLGGGTTNAILLATSTVQKAQ